MAETEDKKNGRIRTFKTRIRIGEKTRIRPDPDSKHCVNLSRFSSLDKQEKGYLTREDFLRIPELAINPLGDRIVHSFFSESNVCIVYYCMIVSSFFKERLLKISSENLLIATLVKNENV